MLETLTRSAIAKASAPAFPILLRLISRWRSFRHEPISKRLDKIQQPWQRISLPARSSHSNKGQAPLFSASVKQSVPATPRQFILTPACIKKNKK